MTVFYRTLVAVLIAATLCLWAGAASAHPAAPRACTNECIYYQGWTGQPGWFRAEWTTNGNFWFIRGVAKCGNGTRNTILQLGGWHRDGNISKATCTSSYPNLDGAAYDVKHCSTCSYTRTWVSIPARLAMVAGRFVS